MPVWNSMRQPGAARTETGNEWLSFRVLIFKGVSQIMEKIGAEGVPNASTGRMERPAFMDEVEKNG